MRLKSLGLAAVLGAAAFASPGTAVAQEAPWFFCYVDPPTFGRGTYVYTRVNYIGGAQIPQGAISAAMAADNPQVSGRQITCWRYATEAEAEDRRRQGMAGDRGRNYTVHEIGWASPYSPPPVSAEPVASTEPESAPPGAASSTAKAAPDPLAPGPAKQSAATPAKPAAPVTAKDSAAPVKPAAAAASSAKAIVKPTPPAKPKDDAFAQEVVQYQQKMAEYERQQAAYARALQDQQQRLTDLAAQSAQARDQYKQQQSRYDQQRQQYERQRAQWEADAEACKAGDRSKCAKAPE